MTKTILPPSFILHLPEILRTLILSPIALLGSLSISVQTQLGDVLLGQWQVGGKKVPSPAPTSSLPLFFLKPGHICHQNPPPFLSTEYMSKPFQWWGAPGSSLPGTLTLGQPPWPPWWRWPSQAFLPQSFEFPMPWTLFSQVMCSWSLASLDLSYSVYFSVLPFLVPHLNLPTPPLSPPSLPDFSLWHLWPSSMPLHILLIFQSTPPEGGKWYKREPREDYGFSNSNVWM